MYGAMRQNLASQLEQIRSAGLWKDERVLTSPQQARVSVRDRIGVLNMCAE